MDNLKFYEASRAVPAEAQKQFNNGSFSGTDINPMWRIKKLTELFGPCGIGWYYDIVSERPETYGETVMAIVDINLYIKVDGEWSKPIYGTGGNTLVKQTKSGLKPSDEGYKMALTDALSVACKALGIGADIYFAKDRTKYSGPTNAIEEPEVKVPAQNSKAPENAENRPQTADKPLAVCKRCGKGIVDTPIRGGEVWPVSQIVGYSMRRYEGNVFCPDCMKAIDKEARDAG